MLKDMTKRVNIGLLLFVWIFSLIQNWPFSSAHSSLIQSESWETFPKPYISGGVISKLMVDPLDTSHLFALQEQTDFWQTLLDSHDASEHWEVLYTFQDQWIQEMAIDPVHPEVLYAGGSTGIFRSENGGKDWTQIADNGRAVLAPQADTVYVLETSSSIPDCPTGPSFFMRSVDRGNTWNKVPLGCASVGYLAVAPSNSQVIYLPEVDPSNPNMDLSLASSQDGGYTWNVTLLSGPLFEMGLFPLTVDPADPLKIYSSSGTGIIVSKDGGQTWAEKLKISGMGIFRYGFSGSEIYAGFDSHLFGGRAALYYSQNGGETWNLLAVQFPANLNTLLVVPGNTAQLYIGLDGYGIYNSYDGGQSWQYVNNGLVSTTRIERLSISPGAYHQMFAITYWPRWTLLKSNDGGLSWSQPLLEMELEDVVSSPENPDLVWAVGPDGWQESQDGGDHWNHVSSLSGFNLAVSPAAPERACAPHTGQGQGYLVCRTPDPEGGETWLSYPVLGSQSVYRLAISPTHGDRIFVSGNSDGQGTEIYHSEDGGKTWMESFQCPSGYGVTDLAVSGGDPAKVIAITEESFYNDLRVYQSLDSGKTWQELTNEMDQVAGGLWDISLFRAFIFMDTSGAAYYAGGNTVLAQPAANQSWQILGRIEDGIYAAALDPGAPGNLWLAGEKSFWRVPMLKWTFLWFPIVVR